jgi:hypothetical protein
MYLFCQSHEKSHPNPKAMLPALEEAEQIGLSYLEARPVGDVVIVGF